MEGLQDRRSTALSASGFVIRSLKSRLCTPTFATPVEKLTTSIEGEVLVSNLLLERLCPGLYSHCPNVAYLANGVVPRDDPSSRQEAAGNL